MIGLVLVTHGRLADEFKAALEHVMGPQKQIEAITIGKNDSRNAVAMAGGWPVPIHNTRIGTTAAASRLVAMVHPAGAGAFDLISSIKSRQRSRRP